LIEPDGWCGEQIVKPLGCSNYREHDNILWRKNKL